MDRRRTSTSWTDRVNRRGCLILAALLVLIVAALAFIGFHGDPINNLAASIPTLGGLVVGLPPRES